VDRSGKFVWKNGEAVLAFGKHRGQSLRRVAEQNAGYLEWVLNADFPPDARELVERALQGEFPQRGGG
jgi:uncharacterized protein (DUF3820 family)